MTRSSAAWAVFAVALILRLGWVVASAWRGGADLYPDEELHWQIATNLVQHGSMATNDGRLVARMPAYPLFLAPFALLGEVGPIVARITQALLSAATAMIVFALARRATRSARVALAAGLLVAIDPLQVFLANLLLTETPYTLAGVALAYLGWRLSTDAGPTPLPRIALTGAIAAICILLRPSAAGLVVILLLALPWLDFDRIRGVRHAAVCALIVAVVMLPWGWRNHATVGEFCWLSANGGVTLYDGQGPQARGDSDQRFLNELPELHGLSEIERDRRLRDMAVRQMTSDPPRVLRLAWAKFLRTWNFIPNVETHNSGPAAWASAAYSALVIPTALLAVLLGRTPRDARSRHRRRVLSMMLWTPIVYYTLLHCVYVGSLRYRAPVMPLMALAAATLIAPRREA